MHIEIDQLTDAQLDRLQQRLTARANQLQAARFTTERDRTNTSSLRPQIGTGGRTFGNELARRNWDQECIQATKCQPYPYAVAPGTSVLARDGRRMGGGEEVRPSEHLDARLGSPTVQIARLIEDGFVLARETTT